MTSFKKFLKERDHQTPLEVAKLIKSTCGQFLSTSGFNSRNILFTSLFRGIRHTHGSFSEWTTRQFRDPVDSSQAVHDVLDNYFYDQFGVHFRSSSVFCTGSINFAKDYGEAHLIFPVDDFKFVWSPTVSDAFTFFGKLGINDDVLLLTHDLPEDTPWAARVAKYLQLTNPYKAAFLKAAIASQHEIMIACKRYYSLYIDHDKAESKGRKDDIKFTVEVLRHLGELGV